MLTHEENKGRVWQLRIGAEVVTEIEQTNYEFPWTYGDVIDIDRFNILRAYFYDPDEWPDTPEFAAVVEQIQRNGLALYDTRDETMYPSFTLNAEHDTDSGTVWFRHNAVEELDAEADTF